MLLLPILTTFVTLAPVPDAKEYEAARARIEVLVRRHPGLITKHSIGRSRAGRDLTVLRISRSKTDDLPGMFFGGSIHGREYSHQDVLFAVERILSHLDNPAISELFDTRILWVMPMMNPDGVYDTTRWNEAGVDLNRNFGYAWKPFAGPESSRYPGPRPFSEPESRAVRRFLREHPRIAVYLDIHRAGQVIFAPFGGSPSTIPESYLAIYRGLNETMGGYNGDRNPQIQKAWSALIGQAGFTIDWVYGQLGAYAFTWECPGTLHGLGDADPRFRGALYLLMLASEVTRVPQPRRLARRRRRL